MTSGGFGPTVNGPVAMGYVETAYRRRLDTEINLIVRDKPLPAAVARSAFHAPQLQTLAQERRDEQALHQGP